MGGNYDFHPWRTSILIGAVTALISQVYFSVFSDSFRISPSVILLPLFLMTIGRQLSTIRICSITALIVLCFRILIAGWQGGISEQAIREVIPGAVYYVFYGLLFRIQVPSKRAATFSAAIIASFYCDFGANLMEIGLRRMIAGGELPALRQLGLLILIAVIRSLLAAVLLFTAENVRTMQVRDIHEQRYQSMFMLITELKSEIFLMRKSSEEIEQVMGSAYRLHEMAERLRATDEIRSMTLGIARDVHEIKKDYIRIMDGLESTINAETEEEQMSFRELLEILEGIASARVRKLGMDIRLFFACSDDFVTKEHYALMTVLQNLLSNAIEAIEGDRRAGKITVRERRQTQEGEKPCIVVEVEDDGPGITQKQLDKIFRMGYTTKFDGRTGNIYRGVGLAGVKQTVEEYFGGSINVESEPGERTCFQVVIPEDKLTAEQTGNPGQRQNH